MIVLNPAHDSYIDTVTKLISRYERETKNAVDKTDDLPNFGVWLVDVLRPTLGPNSWRSYRYQLQTCLNDAEFKELISVKPSRSKREVATKLTSANRAKHLKSDRFRQLNQYLKRSHSRYARPLYLILSLGRKLGLRPSEWNRVTIASHDAIPHIAVESTIKGHRHSPKLSKRYVPLDHLSSSDLDELDELITFIVQQPDFKDIQTKLTQFMKNTSRVLFFHEDNRPTLYSPRHQFAANLKASGIDPVVIAAIMGHTDTNMQTKYYGRTTDGEHIVFNESAARQLNRHSLPT